MTPVATTRHGSRVASTRRTSKVPTVRPLTVEAHQGLVHSVAQRYNPRHLAHEDLIQEGNIGLMRGLERFDPARGTEPSTFLTYWVRAAIRRAIANKAREVRVPCWRLDSARGRERTGELACEISLDKPLGNGAEAHEQTLHEMIARDEPSPEALAALAIDSERVQRAMASLSPRSQHVLRGRYWRGKTLLEVGNELGLTRERIRQIEAEALGKLRRELRAN